MTPDIIAKITLYQMESGGRGGPTPSDQFGCLVEVNGEYFDCRIVLDRVGALSPGQTAAVPIRFLRPDLVLPLLETCRNFRLWDRRVIGHGEVEQIVASHAS